MASRARDPRQPTPSITRLTSTSRPSCLPSRKSTTQYVTQDNVPTPNYYPPSSWGACTANTPTKVAKFVAMMRVRKSKEASTISSRHLRLCLFVHAADIQDRDGTVDVLKEIRFAIRGCAMSSPTGGMLAKNSGTRSRVTASGLWKSSSVWTMSGVLKSCRAMGCRAHSRLARCRCLVKNWQRSSECTAGWATIASIRMTTRRIVNLSIS